jgi:hypothetical protein
VRNCHERSFPAGLVLGASVFVCDNLSFSGEVRLARKHTSHIARDLPQLIDTAVGRLGDLRRSQEVRFAASKRHELTDAAAHDLLVQALDARVLPVTKLPLALSEWRAPRHPEFREGRTAWRLFNAITESAKGGDIQVLPRRTQALHGIMDVACRQIRSSGTSAAHSGRSAGTKDRPGTRHPHSSARPKSPARRSAAFPNTTSVPTGRHFFSAGSNPALSRSL